MGNIFKSKWVDPSKGAKDFNRDVIKNPVKKVKAEWGRFKDGPYFDPVGFYKNKMAESEEQQNAATQKALDEQKRANAESERLAAEGLQLQEEMAGEEAAMMELQREDLARQKKEREDKQAADDAYEAEEQSKVKSRGRRRIALVNTDQKDENILGNTTTGRKRILGN